MKNKKGFSRILRDLIIVLIIIGLVAFIVPRMIKGGVSAAEVEKCKRVYDYDNDDKKFDDDCPCDYGTKGDYEYYLLEGANHCIIKPKSEEESDVFVLAEEQSGDKKDCYKAYDKLLPREEVKDACSKTDEKNGKDALTKGISLSCANAVRQRKGPTSTEFVTTCKTPEERCNKLLVEQCKKNAGNLI